MSDHRRAVLSVFIAGVVGLIGMAASEVHGQGFVPPPPRPVEPPLADGPTAPIDSGTLNPVDPPVPSVSLRVRVAASGIVDQELEYTLRVENHSQADAHHVHVRNPLPANVRYVRADPEPTQRQPELIWKIGTLKAGANQVIRLFVVPTGEAEVRNVARVQFEHGQVVRTRLNRNEAKLRVQIQGQEKATQYDPVNFTFEVANTGSAEAANVVVTCQPARDLDLAESKPEEAGDKPLSWKLGSLAPGATRRIECKFIPKEIGLQKTAIEVKDAGGKTATATKDLLVEERKTAKLSMKQSGPERALPNQPVKYVITLTNTGTAPANGVQIANLVPRFAADGQGKQTTIPSGIQFLSASGGGRLVGDQVRWNVGTLGPGNSTTVELVLRIPKGLYHNVARAEADLNLKADAEIATDFQGAVGLNIDINKVPDPLPVGNAATYTVKVRNQGTEAATRLGLTVSLPAGVQLQKATGPFGQQSTTSGVGFNPLPLLAGQAEAQFTLEVVAVQAGIGRLRVEVTADQLTSGPLKSEESITVFAKMP